MSFQQLRGAAVLIQAQQRMLVARKRLLRTLRAALALALLVLPQRFLIRRILLFPQPPREVLQSHYQAVRNP